MQKLTSLKLDREFRRIYKRGKYFASPLLVVYAERDRFKQSRMGITVSSKIGNAVVRNRTKRRIKEALRAIEPRVAEGYNLVIVARNAIVFADYAAICATLERLLGKLGLLT